MLLKSLKKMSIQDQLLQLQLSNQAINFLVLTVILILVLILILSAFMIEVKINQDQDFKTAIIFNIRSLNISASSVIKKIIFCKIILILKFFKNITKVNKTNNKSLQNLLIMLIEIQMNRILSAISDAV